MPASKRRRTEDAFVIDHQGIDKFCNHIHRNYPWAEEFLDKSARNISTTNLLQLVEELEGNVADFVGRVRGYNKLANIKRAVLLMHHLILRVKMAGSCLDFGNDKRFESLLTLLVCHFVHVNLVRVMTPKKEVQEARVIYRFAHTTLQNPEAILNAFLCSDLGFVVGTRNQLLQEILLCHILVNHEEYTKTEDCEVKFIAILKCYHKLFKRNKCKSKVKQIKEKLRRLALNPEHGKCNVEDMRRVPLDVDDVFQKISTIDLADNVRKELKTESSFEGGHIITPLYSSFGAIYESDAGLSSRFAGLERKTHVEFHEETNKLLELCGIPWTYRVESNKDFRKSSRNIAKRKRPLLETKIEEIPENNQVTNDSDPDVAPHKNRRVEVEDAPLMKDEPKAKAAVEAVVNDKVPHDDQNGNCLQNEPDEDLGEPYDVSKYFNGNMELNEIPRNSASPQPLVVDDHNANERILGLEHPLINDEDEDENEHAIQLEVYESEDTQEFVLPQSHNPDVAAAENYDSDIEVVEEFINADYDDDSDAEYVDHDGERDEAEGDPEELEFLMRSDDDTSEEEY